MAAAAGPGHAPELIAKEVAFGNGQIRKGGNTLTIEAVAPAPGCLLYTSDAADEL